MNCREMGQLELQVYAPFRSCKVQVNKTSVCLQEKEFLPCRIRSGIMLSIPQLPGYCEFLAGTLTLPSEGAPTWIINSCYIRDWNLLFPSPTTGENGGFSAFPKGNTALHYISYTWEHWAGAVFAVHKNYSSPTFLSH